MSDTSNRGTATIHPFPAGGRASLSRFGAVRDTAEARVTRLFPPVAVVEFGSGWYHDAAIADEAKHRH